MKTAGIRLGPAFGARRSTLRVRRAPGAQPFRAAVIARRTCKRHVARLRSSLLLLFVLALPGCASRSNSPAPAANPQRILEAREGLASYYGPGFHGKLTASGARFDMHEMVAAHPRYPFGTIVRVTNLRNRRSVRVRILDRGPAPGPRAQGVVIDLSYAAAQALRFVDDGRTRVRIEVLRWGR